MEAAIDLAKGKRVANTAVTSVTITPVRKRTPSQIRALRLKLDMSQAIFANILGVTIKAVEAWEAGTDAAPIPTSRI